MARPLRERFLGVAAKRLRLVEVNPRASHQHEINGVKELKSIFGEARRNNVPARFVYLDDENSEALAEEAWVTWYDARKKPRSEHRLYFPRNAVLERAHEGDLLVVAVRVDESLLIIVAREGTAAEAQVRWLFDADPGPPGRANVHAIEEERTEGLEFAAARILTAIGEEPAEPEPGADALVRRFKGKFPNTAEFSTFARGTLAEVDARADPDAALVRWMEREEALFRALERRDVEQRIAAGFAGDVDGFISFSLSVQNRRKARTGQALEHHLEAVFRESRIRYSRGARTAEGTRPDFLFPGIASYRDRRFPDARLTMLGAKSTCKDRWRQVLSEAKRVPEKHLCTLEPGITTSQLDEMADNKLRLVVPLDLHATYAERDRSRLLSLRDFVALVKAKQSRRLA